MFKNELLKMIDAYVSREISREQLIMEINKINISPDLDYMEQMIEKHLNNKNFDIERYKNLEQKVNNPQKINIKDFSNYLNEFNILNLEKKELEKEILLTIFNKKGFEISYYFDKSFNVNKNDERLEILAGIKDN